ncbi:hypothetical protein RHGRI_028802 [Rhododendron griersonianum]|uniref:Uncharacterized protein n=1 Tax=Rhododendron griersonianum TaxID=479676 RepID=A0AAV6IN06_9ERIC|nr:hypothetical protein RHGRI_028802 [Rhododendron griersonianum]
MAKKKLQTQMADQGKKQEHLSTRLQGLFKKAREKQKQNRGNPNRNREQSHCPEIIDVESYSNAVKDPNPLKIPVLERESITRKELERESGDTVTSLEDIVSFNFGCDYYSYHPAQEFQDSLGLEREDCYGSVFDRDCLAMKEGSGPYFRGQEAGVGDVEYSTDDMLKEFLKENLFSC